MLSSLGGGHWAAVSSLFTQFGTCPNSIPFFPTATALVQAPSPSDHVAPGPKMPSSPPSTLGMTEKAFRCSQPPPFPPHLPSPLLQPHWCSRCSLNCHPLLPWASARAFPWLWNIPPGPRQSEYPMEIRKYEYDPNFAIRGLHYDVQRAVLMKIDAFHYIQLGTVYRGLSVVPDEEVIEMYEGSHVPLEQMSDFYGKSSHGNTMKQFMDIFSLPEMSLLSCVNEYFLKNNIDYEPVHLYKDVKDSIRDVHIKGIMYSAIEADIEKYICYAEQTRAVLAKLADHGKKMFLITNSPSSFVDKGMRYIVGKDWRDLFDVVIVQAEKPNFFNDKRRPFRKVNEKGVLLWDKIHKLQKGQIYKQGNLYEFLKLTGWRGSKVLYFGDHIYSDLADLTLKHGWRTGAIIPELRSELRIMNTEQYIQTMTWLQTLTGLLEQMQVHRDAESQLVLQEWKKERKEMREMTKNFFNTQFGSLFRTDQNPTYFLRRLSRFADIYMASLSCLLNYDVSHTFYPRRTPLQHELPAWPDSAPTLRLPLLQEAHAE
uniref:5'-nucleotidase domain containing 3 n=1 Tax=Ursus americanus TaxID=9643 RepID=A0A452R3R2_URSAM